MSYNNEEDPKHISLPSEVNEQLSKKKQRKLAKKEKKQNLWKETRSEVRKARKEKAKEKRKELREKGEFIPKKKKRNVDDISIGGKVIIDCDFDDKMNQSDVKSLFNQIQLLYGANWKYENPLEIRCLGINGKLKDLIDKSDANKWKLISFEESHIQEVKDSLKCVYLTAESENVIDNFDKDTYYIIGGIVDHNKYKRLCEEKAISLNISTARLPIENYIECIGRKVLTVNQVFEIIGQQCENKDWSKTIQKVLPQRKQENKEGSTINDDLSL